MLENLYDMRSAGFHVGLALGELEAISDHFTIHYCGECVTKHFLRTSSYLREASTFATDEQRAEIAAAYALIQQVMIEWVRLLTLWRRDGRPFGNTRSPDADQHGAMVAMSAELRSIRKELQDSYFGHFATGQVYA